jgi:hypothetical protein
MSAFSKGRELVPGDLRVNFTDTSLGREAAVIADDHVFLTDEIRALIVSSAWPYTAAKRLALVFVGPTAAFHVAGERTVSPANLVRVVGAGE